MQFSSLKKETAKKLLELKCGQQLRKLDCQILSQVSERKTRVQQKFFEKAGVGACFDSTICLNGEMRFFIRKKFTRK